MSKKLNRDDVDKFHDYGLYLPTRTVYMGSESYDEGAESGVDGHMTERAIKNLHILDTISAEPITVLLNSPGGDTYHGMGIFDAITGCRSHVTVRVSGIAMSMGAILLQAGDLRLLTSNSKLMLHYGQLSVDDHAKNTYRWAEDSKKFDKFVEQLFLDKIKIKKPGFTLKNVRAMLNFDTILTAQEAVDLGLADGIAGEEDSNDESKEN